MGGSSYCSNGPGCDSAVPGGGSGGPGGGSGVWEGTYKVMFYGVLLLFRVFKDQETRMLRRVPYKGPLLQGADTAATVQPQDVLHLLLDSVR